MELATYKMKQMEQEIEFARTMDRLNVFQSEIENRNRAVRTLRDRGLPLQYGDLTE